MSSKAGLNEDAQFSVDSSVFAPVCDSSVGRLFQPLRRR